MIKAIRGTRDLLPPETALWNFVEAAVRDVFRAYNFQEIRTPIFEETQLFARSVGEETDIVSKEMYTWEDGGGSADAALLETWSNIHANEITKIIQRQVLSPPVPQQKSRFGAGLQVEWKGMWTLVRARYGATNQDVRALEQSGQAWRAMSPGRNIRLLLVTLKGSVPETFSSDARTWSVEVEELDLPEFEAPEFLTLRPENTAGVVRAYIEHNLWQRGLNKLYYIGPQFRRERPQKGRYRQFYQIGAEVIGPASAGSESPARDAEVLEMLATLLDRLGITDWTLELNSVGCPKDRERFNEALRKALERLPAPSGYQSAADLRLQGPRRSAHHRQAAPHQPVSRRRLPHAL
jgi:Histidyl-tRNA synthetase